MRLYFVIKGTLMKLREDGLDNSIAFQRMIIRDMNTACPDNYYYKDNNIDNRDNIGCVKSGPGIYCCTDSWSGKDLTYAEFFDMHAMTMMVIAEVCQRDLEKKKKTDIIV